MNDNFEPGIYGRRRSNRAVLTVVAMAFAAIALNDGIRSLATLAGESRPTLQRLAPEEDRKARTDAIALCDASGGDARSSPPPSSAR